MADKDSLDLNSEGPYGGTERVSSLHTCLVTKLWESQSTALTGLSIS